MFPDAKFIHIHRNPYHVFLSMMRFMRIVIPLYCVLNPPEIDIIENNIMNFYKEIYKKYFIEKKLFQKEILFSLNMKILFQIH